MIPTYIKNMILSSCGNIILYKNVNICCIIRLKYHHNYVLTHQTGLTQYSNIMMLYYDSVEIQLFQNAWDCIYYKTYMWTKKWSLKPFNVSQFLSIISFIFQVYTPTIHQKAESKKDVYVLSKKETNRLFSHSFI